MARLRDNVLASYAGHAWIALMGFAFVPAYLRQLGAERFGMVAFMLSLQSISMLLDFGVSVFLGRELAQRAHDPARRGSIPRLIRSFEWLVWPTAVMIALAIFAGSGPISTHWLKLDQLGAVEADRAIKLIGLAVALLWPTSFYTAALAGLERQLRLNALAIVFATLRFGGALLVLVFTRSGLQGFLLWYTLVAAAQSAASAWLLWRSLPENDRPVRFDLHELAGARRFALGVFATTAFGLLLSPVVAALAMSLSSVSVIGNALRLRAVRL